MIPLYRIYLGDTVPDSIIQVSEFQSCVQRARNLTFKERSVLENPTISS